MKKLIIICAALLLASPAWGILYTGNSDYTNPYTDDQYTMALWHFDESSVTDTPIIDSSTWDDTGHDMEIKTGLNFQLAPANTWVTGKAGFDTAAYTYYNSPSDSNIGPFTGPDAYGTLSNVQSWGDDYTYEFWMKPSGTGHSSGRVILKKHACFGVLYTSGNHIFMGWYAPGGWYGVTDTNKAIPINDWTHVMITADCTSDTDTAVISFYYNGVFSYSHTTSPEGKTFGGSNSSPVTTLNNDSGTLSGNYQYYGLLDEVRISNCLRIPEPTTISLLAMAALAFLRRKK
jgi:hypothetical protein